MKKLLLIALAALSINAKAATHNTQSFLPPGIVDLLVPQPYSGTNTTTITNGQTNTIELALGGPQTPTTYGNASTIIAYSTNSLATYILPGPIGGGTNVPTILPYSTNLGQINPVLFTWANTNLYFFEFTNGYTLPNGNTTSPWNAACGYYSDYLGQINSNISVTFAVNGDNVGATNTIIVRLMKSTGNLYKQYYTQYGGPAIYDTNLADMMSITNTLNGTNPVVSITQVPASFANGGIASVGVYSIGFGTTNVATTTNAYVYQLSLNGYVP